MPLRMQTLHLNFPFASSFLALAGGILAGYWIGQTSAGRFLPDLLAVGTVLSFITATYFASFRAISTRASINNRVFFLFCMFISAGAIGSSVSATAAWQLSVADRIAGFIPYSDASDYYKQTLEWPAQTLDVWNSRRPLNAALNILEFDLGGSTLLGMVLVRVVLAVLAITSFIVALALTVGRSAALTAGFVLLIWTWPYASSLQSEINGITFSAAGYALLLVSLIQRRPLLAHLGLFAMVLANGFRPYNPLTPALLAIFVMLSLSTSWRKGLKVAGLTAVSFTFLGILLPHALYLSYGHVDGRLNANAGSTVLGLARGTDWKEASEFVETIAPELSEREKSSLMYQMAIESAKQDLMRPARALMIGLAKAIYFSQQELAAAFGFSRHIVGNAQSSPREFILFLASRPSIWLTSLFAFLSVVLMIKDAKKDLPANLMAGISVISFVTMAPLAFGDGYWRVAATLYPGLSLLTIAIPLKIRNVRWGRGRPETQPMECRSTIPRCGWEIYAPIAIICFVLIAMPYPTVARLLSSDTNLVFDALILDIRDNEIPRWTGFNRAVVTPRELIAWSMGKGHGALTEFLAKYGRSVRQVHFEKGIYVLMCDDGTDIPRQPSLLTKPEFEVRIAEK